MAVLSVAIAGCRTPADLPPAPQVVTIAAEIVNNLVLVPVSVNGSKPAAFILDTSASSSTLDRPSTVGGVSLDIGGVTLPGGDINARDLSSLEAALGRDVAGILGAEIFKERVVEIDYANHVVRLHEPSGFHYTGTAPPIAMVFKGDIPLVRPIFTTPDGDELDAKLELATGETGALTLIRPFVIGADLVDASKPPANAIRLKLIRLGNTSLENVAANVATTASAAGVTGETMGLLGGEVLRRFRVFVDYSRSQLFLEPNEHVREPF
jgi:hypothetical protein